MLVSVVRHLIFQCSNVGADICENLQEVDVVDPKNTNHIKLRLRASTSSCVSMTDLSSAAENLLSDDRGCSNSSILCNFLTVLVCWRCKDKQGHG